MSPYKAIIFDLGDVLFNWSSKTNTNIPSKVLHRILSSDIWQDYERGAFSETECYDKIGEAFTLSPNDVRKAFEAARESLKVNHAVSSILTRLKKESQDNLVFYAMSNISVADFQYLRALPADWDIFDEVFASGIVGMRKPDMCFYKYVLKRINLTPADVIFVDDKVENVISAQALGIKGIQFQNAEKLDGLLSNLLGDPILRGEHFLKDNAKSLYSSIDKMGINFLENFAQLLVLDITGDGSLVNLKKGERQWNFFIDKPTQTTTHFPNDLDTTSTALRVLPYSTSHVHSIMDEMLQYINSEGIIQTYFDKTRPRTDPIVALNTLHLFHAQTKLGTPHSRHHELRKTQDWTTQILSNRAYLDGTRYYPSPDAFLYFFARMWDVLPAGAPANTSGTTAGGGGSSPGIPTPGLTDSESVSNSDSEQDTVTDLFSNVEVTDLKETLKPILTQRILERSGVSGTATCLAMRLAAGAILGLQYENANVSAGLKMDVERLQMMQFADGGWEGGMLYRYGSCGAMLGNRGVTTALAVFALRGWSDEKDERTNIGASVDIIGGKGKRKINGDVEGVKEEVVKVSTTRESPRKRVKRNVV